MNKPPLDDQAATDGIQRHVMEQRQKRLQVALMQYPELAQAEPFENVARFAELREQIIEPAMRAFSQDGSLGGHAHHIVTDNDHTDEALAVVGAGIRLILSETALPNGVNLYEVPTLSFFHDRVKQCVQCRVEIYDSSQNGEDRLVQCPDLEAPLDFEAISIKDIVKKLQSFTEKLSRY